MAETKKKTRNILIWLLALAVILVGCLTVFDVFFRRPAQPAAATATPEPSAMAEGNREKPAETEKDAALSIDVKQTTVYDLSDVDFKFAVVTLQVRADGPVNLGLDHFRTDEGVVLSDVQSYVKKLEEKSLFLGRQNVWFSLISAEPEFEANIFVPVLNRKAEEITLNSDLGEGMQFVLNLKNPSGTKDMLSYHAEDIITDGETYQLSVSAAYDITGETMYENKNGELSEYLLPSTVKVYAFRVKAVSLWGDVIVIEDAQYVPSDGRETLTALEASVRSMKLENILGREIREADEGTIFFYAFDPDDRPVSYNGVLKLKLQGSDNWIDVNVRLN